MTPISEIARIITHHKGFLITTHKDPEGDAVGSSLALGSLLRRLGKKVSIFNQNPPPANLRFLPHWRGFKKFARREIDFEVAFILDCPNLERIGKVCSYIDSEKILVNIDHHISNENFARINWVDVKASSVGEMIYRLFGKLGLKMNRAEALYLYTAIVTDTGYFRFSNTTIRSHRIASRLLDEGIRAEEVYQNIYKNFSLAQMKSLGAVLSGLKPDKSGRLAWLNIGPECKIFEGDSSELLFELMGRIKGLKILILFKQATRRGNIKVSFRSDDPNLDLNHLAKVFGGGGHKSASGCTIQGDFDSVKRMVLKKATELLSPPQPTS